MTKFLDERSSGDVVVHVVLHGNDDQEYDCVGVLMKEEKDLIRVAFNAIDGVVRDYLDIQRSEIVAMNMVDNLGITVFS